ncbi:MAG: hypothetical protein WBQ25_12930 [Nitrososphaeraceae archaeon]
MLENSRIQIIFWGTKWDTSPTRGIFRRQIKDALRKIFDSDYFEKLNQYRNIHSPFLLKAVTNTVSKAPRLFTDRHMHEAIMDLILDGTLSYEHDTAYILIPAEDMTLKGEIPEFVDGGHDFFKCKLRSGDAQITVRVPFGYVINFNQLSQITLTCTHEIVEIVTNPEFDGIYGDSHICAYPEDNQCELADICETRSESANISDITVSRYWSNIDQRCVS